jgi:hypothetical protein
LDPQQKSDRPRNALRGNYEAGFYCGMLLLSNEAAKQIVAAPALERHLAPAFDDLKAVAVELRFMKPGVALRYRLGGQGYAGADEFRAHTQVYGGPYSSTALWKTQWGPLPPTMSAHIDRPLVPKIGG